MAASMKKLLERVFVNLKHWAFFSWELRPLRSFYWGGGSNMETLVNDGLIWQ